MIAFKLLQRQVLASKFTNQLKYQYQKDKISLFKAHQNRQIQDRDLDDQQIKLNNDIKKVDPYSDALTTIEIANFDIYYGRFETVGFQGTGQNKKLVKSLKKYDVDLILRKKLKEDYDTIINFIKERQLKMKANEYIYIFQYFQKNKELFLKFLEEEMNLFTDVIIKGLCTVNIYSTIEFVKLQKLVFTFDIKDESIQKNFLVKGNLLFANNQELENVYDSLLQVFKIFLSYEFKDLSSQGIMIQLKKKLLRGLHSMDLIDCIELFSLIAERNIFIDPVQIRFFEERFISNKEILFTHQFATIFDSMGKLNYQPQELAEYFSKHRFPLISTIVPISDQTQTDSQTIILNKEENIQDSYSQSLKDQNNLDRLKDENPSHITMEIFTQIVRGFSQINFFATNQQMWIKVEDMIQNYCEQFSKIGEFDKTITSNQFRILIGSFEKTQMGTNKIWNLFANRREYNLSYDENYLILKNLSKYNIYNPQQLNLALSYILDEETDLPRFELVLQKETPQKALEKLQVYALIIYKYIEETGDESTQFKNELEFKKQCMKQLLKESVNSLIKGQEKKWKKLSENEQIKLYGLLHLCEYKSNYQITQEISPLERKISKERKTYNMQQVAFITLMQESFASEEQYSKWKNSNQLEFSTYLSTFYQHGLCDAYLWSLMLVKFIELIELFHVDDLLTIMLIFLQKQNIEEEIWQLFTEVLRIKAVKQHTQSLNIFSQELTNQQQKQSIIDIIKGIEDSKEKENEQQIQELNYLEQFDLSLNKVIAREEPLSVYKASNIKYVLNLMN